MTIKNIFILRKILLLLLIAIASGCHKQKNTSVANNDLEKNVSALPKELVPVEILVTRTSAYCGGAEPDPGMLDKLNAPTPFGGKKIFVRKGEVNDMSHAIVDSSTTDQNGLSTFKLSAGTYCVVYENKATDKYFYTISKQLAFGDAQHEPIDKKCLMEWLLMPEFVFTVAADTTNRFTMNYYNPCPWQSIPCTQYTGPLPP